jgi:hypothetical protein
MDLKRIMKRFEDARFCYGRAGGQGHVDKSECTCTQDHPCQAKIDKDRFHEAFKSVSYGDINARQKVLKKIKTEFKGSQWYKDNVRE